MFNKLQLQKSLINGEVEQMPSHYTIRGAIMGYGFATQYISHSPSNRMIMLSSVMDKNKLQKNPVFEPAFEMFRLNPPASSVYTDILQRGETMIME